MADVWRGALRAIPKPRISIPTAVLVASALTWGVAATADVAPKAAAPAVPAPAPNATPDGSQQVGVRISAHGASADAYREKGDQLTPEVRAAGERVYGEICSTCHETGVNRAPQRFLLEQMSPESILRALTSGVMQPMAAGLPESDRQAVAQYITKRPFGTGSSLEPKMCTGAALAFDMGAPPAFAGWGIDAKGTHDIPGSVSGLDKANIGKLKLKWAFAFPNALRARSQPAIAGGAIFVGSHNGTVYALDIKTGCARWTFNASAEVRTGIVVSPWKAGDAAARPLAFFGDLVGNAYAVDALTGKQVWRRSADDHPARTLTAAPVLMDDTLLIPVSSLEEGGASKPDFECCTFRGSLLAVDPATGKDKWRTWLVDKPMPTGKTSAGKDKFGPSGVPVWNSPVLDYARHQIYLATGDNYSTPATGLSDSVVALDMATGKVKWHYQALGNDAWNGSCDEAQRANCPKEDGPDFDFGAGVVLAHGNNGKDVILAGQKSGWAYGVDPDSGALVWKRRLGRGGVVGGIHFGLATANGIGFFPVSDPPDGRKYDEPAHPGVYALDVATGAPVWSAPSADDVCKGRKWCYPGYGGALTMTNGMVLAGANDGYIRIYDAKDGKVLWQVDTAHDFVTVDGSTAHGGSIGGGASPVAYHGMMIANSGYGFAGKMPGNVLLVYDTAP